MSRNEGNANSKKQDQLIIEGGNQPKKLVTLSHDRYTLGKDPENDIVLDGKTVSRFHAELRKAGEGWTLTDLNSRNGTDIEGDPLVPGERTPFMADFLAHIGSFYLRWEKDAVTTLITAAARPENLIQSKPLPRATREPASVTSRPIDSGRRESRARHIRLKADPINFVLDAGSRTTMKVTLSNRGEQVDHIRLSIDGLPPEWYTITKGERVELMPHKNEALTATVVITLHPPKQTKTEAKTYTFSIIATPNISMPVRQRCTLVINPFDEMAVRLHPTQVKNNSTTKISVTNKGNAERTFRITGQNPANEVDFRYSPDNTLQLKPGRSGEIGVFVAATTRLWTGNPKQLPFSINIASQNAAAPPIERQGSLTLAPLIPRWLISLMPIFLLLFCGIGTGGALWNRARLDRIAATTAAIAFAKETATQQVVNAIATQDEILRLEVTVNAQETRDAYGVTATAEYELEVTGTAVSDVDGDGLEYHEEIAFGTDPEMWDTDNDGLDDGDEIRQYNTNPLANDTDTDGLTDGEEVLGFGTLPTVPDSDGDGLLDGQDPFPLELPTAIPPPPTPRPPTLPPPTPLPPTATPTPLSISLKNADGEEVLIDMVRVPAGPFSMGAADGDGFAEGDERPLHTVNLGNYWISRTEITNEVYRIFLESQPQLLPDPNDGCLIPELPADEALQLEADATATPLPNDFKNHPVVCVNQRDTDLFARWLSAQSGLKVRIPSEPEWEKAARGFNDTRIYPWGGEFNGFLLNYCEFSCPDLTVVISDGGRETVAVDTYPNNKSPFGAVDMVGNVAEWTRSIWGNDETTPQFVYPYSNPNDGREAGTLDDPNGTRVYYVVRGGGWNAPQANVRVSSRDRLPGSDRHPALGFRIVVYE